MGIFNVFKITSQKTIKLEKLQQLLTDISSSIQEHQQKILAIERDISKENDERNVRATAELTREKLNDMIITLEAWQKKLNKF